MFSSQLKGVGFFFDTSEAERQYIIIILQIEIIGIPPAKDKRTDLAIAECIVYQQL